jgi:hypothetical protein
MKIEGYQNQVENRPRAAPEPGQIQGGGFGEIAHGLSQLGAGVDTAVQMSQEADRQAEREKYEADVVAARDALTELERKKIERLYGQQQAGPANSGSRIVDEGDQGSPPADPYLETRGMAAAEQRADVLRKFETDRQAIWGALKNDQQRALFQRQAAEVSNHMLATVESHTAQQVQQAKFDSVKAAESSAVRQAALAPGDDNAAENLIAGVVGPARGLATSRQVADEAAIAVRANVTKARLDQLLNGNSDWQSAERVLTKNRAALGADADKYDKAINNVKLGAEAQTVAFGIVKDALDPTDGQVDQTKILDAIEKVPADKREKVEPIVYRLTAEREQAYAADTKRISTAAFTFYNAKGWGEFQKSGLSTELNARNPELYNRLRDDARAQFERAKRLKRDSLEDRRRQDEINRIAIREFTALPTDEQANADIGQFLLNRGTGGVHSDKDPVPSALSDAQKKARDQVQRGLGVAADTFVGDMKGALQPFAPPRGTTKESRARASDWWSEKAADARNAYNLWLDNNPGKKPTREDLDGLRAEILGGLPPRNQDSAIAAGNALSQLGGGSNGRKPPPAHVDIPAQDRTQIEAALKKKGKVITEDAIQALYRQVHGGK